MTATTQKNANTFPAQVRSQIGALAVPVNGSSRADGGASGDVFYFSRTLNGVVAAGNASTDLSYSPTAFHWDIFDRYDASAGIFSTGARIRHLFGGTTAKGGRNALSVGLSQQYGATASDNNLRAFTPLQTSVYSAGDGGVGGSDVDFQGTATSGSAILTGIASTTGITAGMLLLGAGFPDGSYVVSVTSTTLTASKNFTSSGTLTLTATGYRGEYYGTAHAAYGFSDTVSEANTAPMINVLNLTVSEDNLFTVPGTIASFMSGRSNVAGRAARGVNIDAGYLFSAYAPPGGTTITGSPNYGNNGPNLGWRHLLAVSDSNSQAPIDSQSTIFGAIWLAGPRINLITAANPGVCYIYAPVPSIQGGDIVTVTGVVGTGWNKDYTVAAVTKATSSSLATITFVESTASASGSPDFSKARITIKRRLVSGGIDFSGLRTPYLIQGPAGQIGDSFGGLDLSAARPDGVWDTMLSVRAASTDGTTLTLQSSGSGLPPYFITTGDFIIRTTGGGQLDFNHTTAGTAGSLAGYTIEKLNGVQIKRPYYNM